MSSAKKAFVKTKVAKQTFTIPLSDVPNEEESSEDENENIYSFSEDEVDDNKEIEEDNDDNKEIKEDDDDNKEIEEDNDDNKEIKEDDDDNKEINIEEVDESKDLLASSLPKYMRQAEGVLSKKQLKKIKNKKLKGTLQRTEKRFNEAARKAASSELLLTEEAGHLEAEGMEKTSQITQEKLKEHVDLNSASKIFNLNLPTFGPYALDYTRNGRYMLIGGRKGHIATFDWQTGRLGCEFHVKETVRDVKWLHNEQYFAVAQKKYVYIYDQNGLEVHRLKRHIEPNRLEFLPYHFLLVSVGNAGWLKYQDTSTGKFVVELRTRLGRCDAMTQNPWNAIIHLGHANGTVTLWSPNMSTPLVKMLTHKGPVTALAVDRTGKYMATSGLDGKLKLWDVRTYKSLQEYFTPTPACSLSISQLGLLAVGWGPHISVCTFILFLPGSKSPYMTHIQRGTQLQDLHFCPYEDVLGFGHSQGISSLIIPGSGEPNFDSLEANPFQTKKQRQEAEIQPEMITLDPSFIGKMDRAPQELREKERMERELKKAEQVAGDMSNPRKKTRGKNSSLKRYLRKKNKNVIDEKRVQFEEKIARERQEREKRKRGELDHDKAFTALDRFSSDYSKRKKI
ncbi:12589_t:CDS:10 [Ambispora gerdemannii]|uniref:U three protein 7 n=1 Tax=Ambispora gerdemannii TaxID=144530 RepID=A0A9N9GLX9_9GLOM|nr:12589_t:CDS:10 [Ambispora gerdemannii]